MIADNHGDDIGNERRILRNMRTENRPTSRIVCIRLLQEEAEILEAKAKKAKMSKARFLKNIIRYGSVYEKKNFLSEDAHKLQYEIDRIGNNMNQIFYRVYNTENIDEIEVLRLKELYTELLSTMTDFVTK